jgi:hypothetical protein
MLPAKTAISAPYPNPSNATARQGFSDFWDAVNEFQQKSELDLASAATCDIGGQLSTKLRITGTTGITSFGANYRGPILLRFSGAVTLTNNSTTLRCPGGANYTTAANEVMMTWPVSSVSGTADGWQVASLTGGSLIGAAAITSGTITGITDLAIADGGTGASTAAMAFANLKQAATTSATGVVELATDAEAMAGTDTTRAVTPSNLASAKSYATSGYQKLPGGLIMQWGRSANLGDLVAGPQTVSLTFPLAFPTAVLNVIPAFATNSGVYPTATVVWDFGSSSTTTCAFDYAEYTGASQANDYIVYFALGY